MSCIAVVKKTVHILQKNIDALSFNTLLSDHNVLMLTFLNGFLITTFVTKPAEWIQTYCEENYLDGCAPAEILQRCVFSGAMNWVALVQQHRQIMN